MPKYTFTAIKKDGKTKTGQMEAASQQAVTELLSKQGLKPILVKPVKTGFDPNNLNFSFLKAKKG